jgi:hypothetical protein
MSHIIFHFLIARPILKAIGPGGGVCERIVREQLMHMSFGGGALDQFVG